MENHTASRVHPAAKMHAEEYAEGKIDRREFLTRATALGVTSAAAYSLIGATQPAMAAGHAQTGGTLRHQMEVRGLKEPRVYDWPQIANLMRGNFEYLVEYNNDGTVRGMLVESWDVSDDAKTITLNVRKGVMWDDGSELTAEDVARNISGWCEKDVEGNSMAGRMATLIDADTNKAIEGAIEVVDSHTVRLNLPAPDITIMVGMADYPAAIIPADFNADDIINSQGTGPYKLVDLEVGVKARLERKPDHTWWGTEVYGGPFLDAIEYIDYGTDPAAWLAAIEAEEVDVLYESVGEFIDVFDSLELEKAEVVTGATVVIRTNQDAEVDGAKPYADKRVRQAFAMAVNNEVVLELGYGNRGVIAENHHVAPVHPEYAELPAPEYNPEKALALMTEAGYADMEHELISIDDDWRKNSTDAAAAMMRDAGLNIKRTILPGSTFWNDWAKYPFSSTSWNHRPLGVQILALAYRSGEAWNEAAYSNPEFDSLLGEALSIADADVRREVMAKLQMIMQEDGVIIQPYWRSLYNHALPGQVGTGIHISYEHHHYKFAFAA
ncbi:MAG: ABC transporter substrate-binding protein [Pseudomonadota bacterium]